jgi:SAM-dependent methyltransferase
MYVADAHSFALASKFDTVVAGELIEHLANPAQFLLRVREHLKPGALFVLTTPNPFCLFNIVYAFMKFPKTCSNPDHTCWFCPQTLSVLIQRCGYKIRHFELIEDYEHDNPSARYRGFIRLLRWVGWLIPRRLRCNAMLVVLEADENSSRT